MSTRAAQRPMHRGLLLLVPLLIFAAVFLTARMAGSLLQDSSQHVNPFAERPPFTPAGTAAATAAESAQGPDQQILQRLAGVPTAVWLTPETFPSDVVSDAVESVVEAADEAQRTAVLVVYGITNRDCSGGESSGGLPPGQYQEWVGRIADAAGDDAVVILEPDALATADECGQRDERTQLLADALDELIDEGPTVYVDAGHASWIDPTAMAAMLRAVGVDEARGFSTNVSGYESADDEQAYAEAISQELGGAHYVTDTGRNGAGSTGQWCNPEGRALGREPQVGSSGHVDAYLWIKPPGESDGTCGGGPAAGGFWIERALELARGAGW